MRVFQETNITKRIYTPESSEYMVVTTEAPIAHSGGVAVFYRAADHLSVEALHTYGVNVVCFLLALINRQWFIVGGYLAPDYYLTIEDVIATIASGPGGARCW